MGEPRARISASLGARAAGLAALALAAAPRPTWAQSSPAPPAPEPDAQGELVREVFAPLLEPAEGRTVFPGLVVGILAGGEPHVFELGAVELRSGARADVPCERVLFPVASLTKPLTGLLLARSAARGDVELDAPAVLCDTHPNLCPGGAPITWRQLATHTSGLPVLPGDVGSDLAAYAPERLAAWLETAQLGRAPGAGFEYSTAGYAVLGARLAERRGLAFERLLREDVLEPLGMRDARLALGEADLARLAVGQASDGGPDAAPLSAGRPAGALAPSGGLVASAADLLLFLEACARPAADWRSAVELCLEPRDDVPSYPPSVMALGWQYLTPAGFYWHAGHGSGHHAFMAFERAGQVGVVALANSAARPDDTRLAQASFAALGGLLALEAAAEPR